MASEQTFACMGVVDRRHTEINIHLHINKENYKKDTHVKVYKYVIGSITKPILVLILGLCILLF